MNTKNFEITVAGHRKSFRFEVSRLQFQQFQQESTKNIAMATNNFLLGCSTERERLNSCFEEDWGLPLKLTEVLIAQLAPEREAIIKKL